MSALTSSSATFETSAFILTNSSRNPLACFLSPATSTPPPAAGTLGASHRARSTSTPMARPSPSRGGNSRKSPVGTNRNGRRRTRIERGGTHPGAALSGADGRYATDGAAAPSRSADPIERILGDTRFQPFLLSPLYWKKSHLSFLIGPNIRTLVLEGLLMPRMSVAKSLDRMPEAFVSDKYIARAVSREVKAGKLRKLASRLYTRNMADPPEAVVARNLWSIVAGYFPGSSHCRSYRAGERSGERRVGLSDNRTRPGHRTAGSHPPASARPRDRSRPTGRFSANSI